MFEPVPLNLPAYPFKIKQEGDVNFIFDDIRKKFLVLTPEEWVRQHFVQFIIQEKKYPKTLIKLEGGLKLHSLQKRTDIVVFNSQGEKILMIECKAPSVAINQKVFDQIARYNIVHKIPLLAVSNGLQHYYCTIDFETKSYKFIESLPDYK
ncbi:type I restriction and modification enzyme subunit R-like protein [Arcticibacter tournemirensis]|uniref:Type I restriction enzyme HsdR N-terminal domain-containing protein n=1 Tax=Arcticibacter tournemirensis TaxID=699437 RepID=A0A5M9HDI6_9SPHI|nr:type I restriction enzyme HsdR N-terminal domain-containing protein [Arcticibacter tournemirensis]KAA8484395.1 type I restriction enzyme HsdR N-terminal domain-containing protein [Arcticibacter tournemirensis]TQM49837.1 type I restriction and modification enzyme subunit R-like protein [Arcticibacter tournemirensis]